MLSRVLLFTGAASFGCLPTSTLQEWTVQCANNATKSAKGQLWHACRNTRKSPSGKRERQEQSNGTTYSGWLPHSRRNERAQREHTHRLPVLKSARNGGNGHATCQRAWSQPKHFRLPDPGSAATGGAPSSKCRLWSRLHSLALRMQRAGERRLAHGHRLVTQEYKLIDGCPCTPGLLLPVSGAASGTTAAEYAVARVLLRAPARSACVVAGPATQIQCKVRIWKSMSFHGPPK